MQCDNESVVSVLNFGRSRDLFLQAGMREVVYLLAVAPCELRVVHVSSRSNSVADWLSRRREPSARRQFRRFACDKSLCRVKLNDNMFVFTHNW